MQLILIRFILKKAKGYKWLNEPYFLVNAESKSLEVVNFINRVFKNHKNFDPTIRIKKNILLEQSGVYSFIETGLSKQV